MVGDFRKIERAIDDYLRRIGVPACWAGGDLHIAATTPHTEHRDVEDGTRAVIVVDADAEVEIISLSDLARELAEMR